MKVQLGLCTKKDSSNVCMASGEAARFSCYTATKSGQISRFFLELTQTDLKIISCTKGSVKMSLDLNSFHAKEMPKQLRTEEPKTTDESPK